MRRPLAVAFVASSLLCCVRGALPLTGAESAPTRSAGLDVSARDASAQLDGAGDAAMATTLDDAAESDASPPIDDAMSLHLESPAALRALMGDAGAVKIPIGGGAWRMSQGNRAISQHSIGRRACLDGLREIVLQTPAQRARCGAEGMVPVWERDGIARFCIDIFEFPGRPCELPFVFVTPAQALQVCHMQGKRLCAQDEWNLACRGDPAGGRDRVYAYGDDMDLAICNTDKSRAAGPACDVSTTEKLWTTCGTNTEPSGAFPRCRSRFGVFDQHGNVAEIMTRFEPADGKMYSQLKGSAFFYVDVAKKPTDPGGYWTKYPDQCNFDPRWHVEKLEEAQHMNYHLGFRCCKTLEGGDAAAD